MRMILAIIRPDRLEEVKAALCELGVSGMTVTEGRGTGNEEGHIERYRGMEYKIGMLERIRVEIAVSDDQSGEVVEAIRKAAFTGEVGDGKIFVYALDSCVRVRTGEIGEASI
jgi:nitrogen regulatory protein PII